MTRAPQLLNGVRLGDSANSATWILQDLAGNTESLLLEGRGVGTTVLVNDSAFGYLSPTYLDPALNYWYRYYPEQRLLFFKYNVCAERQDLPFSVFAQQLLRDLDTNAVDSVVVDLRDNAGGNSEV